MASRESVPVANVAPSMPVNLAGNVVPVSSTIKTVSALTAAISSLKSSSVSPSAPTRAIWVAPESTDSTGKVVHTPPGTPTT